jgi:hypothetical protein
MRLTGRRFPVKTGWFVIVVTSGVALAQPAAEPAAAQVERPGGNVGVPLDMVDTCYSYGL